MSWRYRTLYFEDFLPDLEAVEEPYDQKLVYTFFIGNTKVKVLCERDGLKVVSAIFRNKFDGGHITDVENGVQVVDIIDRITQDDHLFIDTDKHFIGVLVNRSGAKPVITKFDISKKKEIKR